MAAMAAGAPGAIPEGFWILNEAKSHDLQPGAQALWIVKDDGQALVWVSVRRDANDPSVTSYSGRYGGEAAPVIGAPMRARISSPGPGRIHNEGEITGLGPYHEDCAVLDAGKAMVCDGEANGPGGVQRWHDHFDYAGPAPGG